MGQKKKKKITYLAVRPKKTKHLQVIQTSAPVSQTSVTNDSIKIDFAHYF